MRFAKLHGLGNDFVLLDLRLGGELPTPARAAELCDRNRGIGADGVLSLLPAARGARLVIHNADGSVPEMCGNGARCAALWIASEGGTRAAGGEVLLETEAGPRPCTVVAQSGRRALVEVDMGSAQVEPARSVPVGASRLDLVPVSLGNPHRVIFRGDATRRGLMGLATDLGSILCRTENANIEFAARTARLRYAVAVWERGAGLTQACGTGACAVAAAVLARGEASPGEEIVIELPGGELVVRETPTGLRMRGPAELVFLGEL